MEDSPARATVFLRNLMERAVLSSGGEISPTLQRSLLSEQSAETGSVDLDLSRALGQVGRKLILRALIGDQRQPRPLSVRRSGA